jgi:hypothetical protein
MTAVMSENNSIVKEGLLFKRGKKRFGTLPLHLRTTSLITFLRSK